jgi:hypothetical protein
MSDGRTSSASYLNDVLSPPPNPWLQELHKQVAHNHAGLRIVRHSSGDDDAIERNASLRQAKQKLRDFLDL